MNEIRQAVRAITALALVAALVVSFAPAAQAGTVLWSHKSATEMKWHMVTSIGTVLVATDEEVISFDPETGKPAWTRNDLKKVLEVQVEEVTGTPLLLISTNISNNKTKLFALDILSGETIWESEQLKGASVGMIPVYEKSMIILLTSKDARAKKDKLDLIAYDIVSGAVKWESEFPDKIEMFPSETSSRWITRFDLSGHQLPVYDADSIYFTYGGAHRFDLATGKLVWALPFDVTEGQLVKANARAILEGDVLYTSAKGKLRAIDKNSGQLKWESKDFGAGVVQMISSGGAIYGRMGGHFYNWADKEWLLKKPLGVVAVGKNGGQAIWKFDDAKDGITNMVHLPEQNAILIADAKYLIGLDTTAEGNVKEAFRVKTEFKYKLSGGAKAAKGALKFAKGGLIGMMKHDTSDLDLPVAFDLRENGMAVLRGKQHILAFDTKAKSIAWSAEFEAPGVPNWQKVVMFAITAMQYAYQTQRAFHTQAGTSENFWANSQRRQVIDNYMKFAGRRYSTDAAGNQYAYILTDIEDGKNKGAGVVGINLNSGQPENQLMLMDKEPNIKVDDLGGRVFNLKKDGKELIAISVK